MIPISTNSLEGLFQFLIWFICALLPGSCRRRRESGTGGREIQQLLQLAAESCCSSLPKVLPAGDLFGEGRDPQWGRDHRVERTLPRVVIGSGFELPAFDRLLSGPVKSHEVIVADPLVALHLLHSKRPRLLRVVPQLVTRHPTRCVAP